MTRSTSSAVTIPSPDVVCSSTMTWPLFSPPRPAPDTCIPSRMYLSPTGVRTTLPAGRLDRLLEPAVREHRHHEPAAGERAAAEAVEGEDAEDLVAVDHPAGRVDRDESVGVAVEGEADVGARAATTSGERRRVRSPRTRR